MANIFYQTLSLFRQCLSDYLKFDKDEPYVLSNYYKQSIGNRSTSHWIKAHCKKGKADFTIILAPGFIPTRIDEDVYNGQPSNDSGNVKQVWQNHKFSTWNQAHNEMLSQIAYWIENLITGSMVSGEQSFKVYILSKTLEFLKPTVLTVTLADDKEFKNVVAKVTKPDLNTLIKVAWPRVELTLNSKLKKTAKPTQRGAVAYKPAEKEVLEV
jgi:hypothetical protein